MEKFYISFIQSLKQKFFMSLNNKLYNSKNLYMQVKINFQNFVHLMKQNLYILTKLENKNYYKSNHVT